MTTNNTGSDQGGVIQADRNLVKMILGETTHTEIGYKIDRGLAFSAEVEAVARHRLSHPPERIRELEEEVARLRKGWQPIDTAPNATGPEDPYILVTGDAHRPARIVQPDGDFWRQRKREESTATTHWMPLPAPPAIRSLSPNAGEG